MIKAGASIIHFLMRALGHLPMGFHRKAGEFIGWLAGSVLHYRREVVAINLSRSFPDLKYSEIKAITRKFYRHFGLIFTEAIRFGALKKAEDHRKMAKVTNPEVLEHAIEVSPSVIVLDTHCGNWEMMAGLYYYDLKTLHLQPEDVVVTYKQQKSALWNEVFRRNRTCVLPDPDGYEGYLETKNVLRYVLTHKNEKKVYFFITDQFPYTKNRMPIGEFMHQPTVTMSAAAELACRLGYSVLYKHDWRNDEGVHEITFTNICDDASASDAQTIMRKYYDLLQADLQKHPENYLWTHKRWK